MQSIGDGEHLINTGSLLSSTRPSLFATDNEHYRNTGNGLSEWITDHRTEQAYSQLNVDDGQISATLKMGFINAESDGTSSKRQGINANTSVQKSISSLAKHSSSRLSRNRDSITINSTPRL